MRIASIRRKVSCDSISQKHDASLPDSALCLRNAPSPYPEVWATAPCRQPSADTGGDAFPRPLGLSEGLCEMSIAYGSGTGFMRCNSRPATFLLATDLDDSTQIAQQRHREAHQPIPGIADVAWLRQLKARKYQAARQPTLPRRSTRPHPRRR